MRPLVFSLTFLLITMLAALALRPSRAEADNPINAVYFSGPTPVIDRAELRAAGVRLVSSFAAFQSAATTADTVILDRESLPSVDRDWLAEQLRQSKLVVGLNVPIVEVAAYTRFERYSPGLGNFLQDYGGQPFYSYVLQRTERSSVKRTGAGSDRIYSAKGFLGLLRFMTEQVTTDHTLTRSPSDPPLPTRPRP